MKHWKTEQFQAPEINHEKIAHEFKTLPSSEVLLFANHLMRPDGFVKTLITGHICSSEEIKYLLGKEFVRTHRGYYKHNKPTYLMGSNDYLSFNLGKPQRMYANASKRLDESVAGLGFVLPATELLQKQNSKVGWGGVNIPKTRELIRNTTLDEPQFAIFDTIDFTKSVTRDYYEYTPPKNLILPITHLARKAGQLSGGDQLELNLMRDEQDSYPRLSLEKLIILMPESRLPTIERYFQLKCTELAPYQVAIQKAFDVDIRTITLNDVLEKYPNIYWFPHDNIEDAVMHLSTHPEESRKLLGKNTL